jgi:hypothetical protein
MCGTDLGLGLEESARNLQPTDAAPQGSFACQRSGDLEKLSTLLRIPRKQFPLRQKGKETGRKYTAGNESMKSFTVAGACPA